MADVKGTAQPQGNRPGALPEVRALTVADIRRSLAEGAADFARCPAVGLIIGAVFMLIGMAITVSLLVLHEPWLIYPFAIGFPLVGPFAAVGLYEVSRRLEAGQAPALGEVFKVIWAQRRREVSWMAFVMLFVFWIWMYQIRLLIALILGRMSFATLDRFVGVVTTTSEGWIFLGIGHVVGAALALVLFSITVISIPMLLDREVDFVTAMITSVRTVLASPVVMLGWGLVVTLAVLAACVPFFLGLLVVLPVLGHATWHLYRRAVV
ncbi:hypothetical protein ASC75_21570 [Aminobacter sp. DSM 101952]|uniref:DUF2189 domain-containing protein n=1 Tax=Aminobacter sp. DSM 101952 TaxID=2735891 RepID=UPI0006FAF080|nr:DUF2189 domain-containing protein [Aminobacter sp. DSM 101952]KQU74358.1 hypothetical protein ASC75_21570 [Aminobacter sp. DSM 101952]